jgi:hypothetical protein
MEAIESADREIALARSEMATRICQLQTRRNTLVPFFRLPLEVLLCIVDFLFIIKKYDSRIFAASFRVESRHQSGWRPFMNVCTRTRTLLLHSPRFWTRIAPAQNPEWVKLCVERSQSLDLSVLFSDDNIPHAECEERGCCYDEEEGRERAYKLFHRKLSSFRQLIYVTLPRARQADLRLSKHIEFQVDIDAALCSSLPCLQSLTYHMHALDQEIDIPTPPAPPLFLRGTPALTFLVLAGIDLSVTDLCFPLLVHLELNGVYVYGDYNSMFCFLKKSPLLEQLHLGVDYSSDPPSARTQPTILLPKLRTLIFLFSPTDYMMHLRALPPPIDELRITVMNTLTASERSQMFDHVWELLDVEASAVSVFVKPTRNSPASARLHIDQHAGTKTRSVSYQCDVLSQDLPTTLERFGKLVVTMANAPYLLQLFKRAATDPRSVLFSVNAVDFRGACNPHAHDTFQGWLRARVAVGDQLDLVDLNVCHEDTRCLLGQREESDDLQRIAMELRTEGLAKIVMAEGRMVPG